MPAAPAPPDEAARLAALQAHHILDTPPEARFDDLTRQAMAICETPIGLVSLVGEKRQWFKSHLGLADNETPLNHSFCAHALLTPDQPLIVPDALADPRFSDNPFVTGKPHIRFYAGVPLRSPEGHALGTLCVIDHVPRRLSAGQIEKLRVVAQRIAILLSVRRRAPAERKLAAGFGLGFAVLLGMSSFTALQADRFLSSDKWVDHTHEVIRLIEQTLFEVQAAESSQRGYSSTGQEGFLPPYQAALATLPAHLRALETATLDNPVQQQNLAVFRSAIDEKLAVTRQRIEQRRSLGAAALEPQYMDGRGRLTMQSLVATGRKMIAVENDLLGERAAAKSSGLHATVLTQIVTSFAGTVLLLLGFWLIRRELRRNHALGGALAHTNTGLENEVGERRRAQQRLGVQHAVAQVAAGEISLAAAAPKLLQSICEHLDWQVGEWWTMHPSDQIMRLAGCWRNPGNTPEEARLLAGFAEASRDRTFIRGEGLPGRAWAAGSPIWEHDLSESGCFLRAGAAQKAGLRRAFAFPLRDGDDGGVRSVIVFLSSEPGAPDPELVATMDTLAGQVAQFTERCHAAARLRASQARFTAFMENAPAVAFIKDEEGRMLYGNQTLLDRFGLTQERWLGHTDYELWPENAPALRAHDQQVLAGEGAVELKESVPLPDGSMSHWLSYKFPLRDEGTGHKLLAGMSIDITERERAETALRAEQEFLAILLDNLQASVTAFDARGQVTHCNRVATLFNGFPAVGPPPPRERWGEFFELLPGEGGTPTRPEAGPLALALRGEATHDQEFIIRLKNGQTRTVSLTVTPLDDGRGQRLGAVAIAHDVTARRQAQEAALLSLREKETLLQEVHHRVKNNLQIIGSLLSMQARRTKSPVALAALAESASRVRSISLVHEKLYRSADLECVDAADYLRSLSHQLMDVLGAERLRLKGRVALDFELEAGHQFSASEAIACGLIVNEALTNSFKHGFPDQRGGRVTVALNRLEACPNWTLPESGIADAGEGEWLRLEIRDDGVGLPPEALTPAGMKELARNSLGMRLVRDLSKQVGGSFDFVPTSLEAEHAGLTVRLTFPVRAGRGQPRELVSPA